MTDDRPANLGPVNLHDMPTSMPERQYQEPYSDYLERLHRWQRVTRERLMRRPDQSRFELIVQLRTCADRMRGDHSESTVMQTVGDLCLIADQMDELIRALIAGDEMWP